MNISLHEQRCSVAKSLTERGWLTFPPLLDEPRRQSMLSESGQSCAVRVRLMNATSYHTGEFHAQYPAIERVFRASKDKFRSDMVRLNHMWTEDWELYRGLYVFLVVGVLTGAALIAAAATSTSSVSYGGALFLLGAVVIVLSVVVGRFIVEMVMHVKCVRHIQALEELVRKIGASEFYVERNISWSVIRDCSRSLDRQYTLASGTAVGFVWFCDRWLKPKRLGTQIEIRLLSEHAKEEDGDLRLLLEAYEAQMARHEERQAQFQQQQQQQQQQQEADAAGGDALPETRGRSTTRARIAAHAVSVMNYMRGIGSGGAAGERSTVHVPNMNPGDVSGDEEDPPTEQRQRSRTRTRSIADRFLRRKSNAPPPPSSPPPELAEADTKRNYDEDDIIDEKDVPPPPPPRPSMIAELSPQHHLQLQESHQPDGAVETSNPLVRRGSGSADDGEQQHARTQSNAILALQSMGMHGDSDSEDEDDEAG